MPIPRLLVAGQSSGVGKTTITAGLITALRKRGLAVQPFKCGPDYIDPTYLTAAAGRPCRNLDTWMLTAEQMIASFDRACMGADIAIIEGVMGLYDGATYTEETGSAAHVAKLLGATVLLVLDVSKLGRSAGALALGYRKFDPSLRLGAFLLNRAGSDSHGRGCAQAITQATGLPVLGWLPKQSNLHVPERHLGLVPIGERAGLEGFIQAAGEVIETWYQVDDLVRIARDGCEYRSTEQVEPTKMDRDKQSAWLLRRHDKDDPRLDGYSCGNLLASYLHVHFAQRPALARRFVVKLERVYASTHSTASTRDTVPPGHMDGP